MLFNLQDKQRELTSAFKTAMMRGRQKSDPEKTFFIVGPHECGKTMLVSEYVKKHKNTFYMSFENLSETEALESFRNLYMPEYEPFENWDKAVSAFAEKRKNKPTFFIFENGNDACYDAFQTYICKEKYTSACCILDEFTDVLFGIRVELKYKTLSDYFKAFPNHSRKEILHLFALTGGIPSVVKELNDNKTFEENLRLLLRYDSAFSATLPKWLGKYFRSPESYYPIIKCIADGHHRLSEIAKIIGFPNNKCGKYLDALIKYHFVVTEKAKGKNQSTYHLANSYFISWGRYIYGKRAMQISNPDMFFQYVVGDMSEAVSMPAFYSACKKFMDEAPRNFVAECYQENIIGTKKSVSTKLRNGRVVIFDYCIKTYDELFVYIFPHTIDTRYTKDDIEDIYRALKRRRAYYNTHIIIFSIERFSDWCVHESKMNDMLHEVTLERLKY